MSLLRPMTCPAGTTLNDPCVSPSVTCTSTSGSCSGKTNSLLAASSKVALTRFATPVLGRFLYALLVLGCSGLLSLSCSDGDGGSGSSRSSNDDSEENDNPRQTSDDSNDDAGDRNDRTDDSDDDAGVSNDRTDSGDNGPDDLPAVDQDAEDSWTVLVYMNGDNDLEHFGLQDIVEMAQVPDHKDVTVLVQVDRAVDGASPGYSSEELGPLGDFTSTKRIRVSNDAVEELDDLGEVNMGDAETLSNFLTWGIQESETGHYSLVFWDHGGGWDLFGPDDSHDHDGLDLPEIAKGLADGLAGAERKAKLDVIGFDACLMATFETAETVRPYASLLLASQELEPGSGWDWTALSVLTTDPSRSGQDWGSEVITKYSRHVGETRNATLSLVDLDKLGDLKDAVDELASDLSKVEPVVVGQVRAQSPEFASGHGKDLVDLGQLISALGEADSALTESAAAVLQALDDVVVSNYQGPDAEYAHGLSLYFPLNPLTFNAEYARLAGISVWQDYLTSYLGAGAEITNLQGGFTNPDDIGDFTYEDGVLYLTGDLADGTADQIISANTYFGLMMDGVVVFLGETEGAWDESQAQGAWDLTALIGYQGDLSAPFYYAQHYSSESQTYSFTTPVLYEGEYLLFYEMVLDSNFDLIAESYYGETEGAIGQVAVPDFGTIQPILLAIDQTGEVTQVPLDTAFDLSQGPISFSFEVLPTGSNVVMALEITDLGGNTDLVYNNETL